MGTTYHDVDETTFAWLRDHLRSQGEDNVAAFGDSLLFEHMAGALAPDGYDRAQVAEILNYNAADYVPPEVAEPTRDELIPVHGDDALLQFLHFATTDDAFDDHTVRVLMEQIQNSSIREDALDYLNSAYLSAGQDSLQWQRAEAMAKELDPKWQPINVLPDPLTALSAGTLHALGTTQENAHKLGRLRLWGDNARKDFTLDEMKNFDDWVSNATAQTIERPARSLWAHAKEGGLTPLFMLYQAMTKTGLDTILDGEPTIWDGKKAYDFLRGNTRLDWEKEDLKQVMIDQVEGLQAAGDLMGVPQYLADQVRRLPFGVGDKVAGIIESDAEARGNELVDVESLQDVIDGMTESDFTGTMAWLTQEVDPKDYLGDAVGGVVAKDFSKMTTAMGLDMKSRNRPGQTALKTGMMLFYDPLFFLFDAVELGRMARMDPDHLRNLGKMAMSGGFGPIRTADALRYNPFPKFDGRIYDALGVGGNLADEAAEATKFAGLNRAEMDDTVKRLSELRVYVPDVDQLAVYADRTLQARAYGLAANEKMASASLLEDINVVLNAEEAAGEAVEGMADAATVLANAAEGARITDSPTLELMQRVRKSLGRVGIKPDDADDFIRRMDEYFQVRGEARDRGYITGFEDLGMSYWDELDEIKKEVGP